jgi:hypothetical protein
VVVLHTVAAVFSLLGGAGALAIPKKSKGHQILGRIFLLSLVVSAVTGLGLDIVRLTISTATNDVNYANATMPSTYPARLTFTYAGFCILYMVHQATPLNARPASRPPIVAIFLVLYGFATAGLIVYKFHLWSGALWMLSTFIVATTIVTFLKQQSSDSYKARIALHRFTMIFLIAFSWWAGWTSFKPAYYYWQSGIGESVTPYTGNLPGEYTPHFKSFLNLWIKPFALGGLIWLYFVIRRIMSEKADEVAQSLPKKNG